ncbi:hypothetical protein FTUN_5384 [Frigoriglobus tundricola]|uniref:Uncharacterized protein n=1 Tax=Frigoriglobus tundricola TaxID=2774151 RepID=A0A6M5YWG7_9BACT|nr:hypothetical protein FTUN_5384 [Frigoriglobus tundricola]
MNAARRERKNARRDAGPHPERRKNERGYESVGLVLKFRPGAGSGPSNSLVAQAAHFPELWP